MKTTNSSISLGQALALLKFESTNEGANKPELKQDDAGFLEAIKGKVKNQDKQSGLNENFDHKDDEQLNDWLINVFCNNNYEKSHIKEIELMNSSFRLFEKFNQVFIDYIIASEDLRKEIL